MAISEITKDMKLCVTFTCNLKYFDKFVNTCRDLIENGKYNGDICFIIGNDLLGNEVLNHDYIAKNPKCIVKYFPDILFGNDFLEIQRNMKREPHWFQKIFQFHKLHLFNTFFKNWDYIFYIDCGVRIYSDVAPIIRNCLYSNDIDYFATPILYAHSDSYPNYNWKLSCQFDKSHPAYSKLADTYNLEIDYFQTTVMFYDTRIISDSTYDSIYQLLMEYPISMTNDQGIIALYFTCINPIYRQFKMKCCDCSECNCYTYDYLSRNTDYKYIMLKG